MATTKMKIKGSTHLLLVMALMTLCNMGATAQQLKKPTLDELSSGGSGYRFTEDIYGLQWWGDTLIKPSADEVTAVNPKNGREWQLLTRQQIEDIVQRETGSQVRVPNMAGVRFLWPGETKALVRSAADHYVVDWKAGTVVGHRTMQQGARNADFCSASGNVAYTIDNNLWVNDRAVTDEPDGIVCGQSVHRNEFGINKGTFWSPDGTQLAFYRMDESMVTEYPLVDIDTRIATATPVRYPMAGMTSHKVTVGVYSVATGRTLYLDAGDPTDRYFTNISWSTDGRYVFLIELNRDQNHAKLCRYDASTGKPVDVLYEEENPKYVEPQNPITFLPWDNGKFIYQSQRDGWNHLYVMDLNAPLQTPVEQTTAIGSRYKEYLTTQQLTQGEWIVQSVAGFNKDRKQVVYTSTEVSPLQTNIYVIGTDGKGATAIGNSEGVHSASLSASGTYVIDRYSTPDVPRNIEVRPTRGNGKTLTLLEAEDPYKDFQMPQIETGTIKAADGKTDLWYRIAKPADFDPTKKYPVIVYVYGGPHAHMIQNSFRYMLRSWDIYMTAQGYVMFTVDGRGSENRGFEFESATFRHLGVEECKDQIKGVEFLKSLPYIDGSRIGVHGWSFGGHMTTALMLRYPDIFKVGVAGGPVIDWSYYEVMYGERYMDTPQTNPDGYRETNLRNLAGNLKGKLLMIHGYQDETCVPQHTLGFMKACIDARTYPDLFLYPGHKHGVAERDQVHLNTKMAQYFIDNL